MQELIKTDDYQVQYDAVNHIVKYIGSFWMSNSEEYAPVANILNQALDEKPPSLSVDLRDLEFMNSSGINMLSKFVIKARQSAGVQIIILGSRDIPWQAKSLMNLPRLLPSIKIEIA